MTSPIAEPLLRLADLAGERSASTERAEHLAMTVAGVTLGRRLATFRTTRAVVARRTDGRDLAERLAAAVDGELLRGPRGCVVRVDAGTVDMPLDRHRLARLPGQPSPERPLICLDTETTGLGTAAGTVAFAVGIGRWEDRRLRVVQLLLPDHPDESALLDAVVAEFGDAPALVTYNGRAFDWPLLVARYRLHGRAAPALGAHLDLLATVRRLFRHRLGQARLRVVEEGLLAVHRHDDVESWEIPGLYLDFLRGGPAAPVARIVRHNAEDVRSLGRLLAVLDRGLADPVARRTAHPGDLAALASLFRGHGRTEEAIDCLDSALESIRTHGEPAPGSGGPDLAGLLAERARLLRRLGRPSEAAAAWEEAATAAGGAGAAAWIELAKVREHALRDLPDALRAAHRARALLERRRAFGRPDPPAEARVAHRCARLSRRIDRTRRVTTAVLHATS